jgi:hypothetical protein
MPQCPQCNAANANRNNFCWSCGEIVHIDPGFAKKVRRVVDEDRKKDRAKKLSGLMAAIAVLGVLGYETITRSITAAVQKAAPIVQARIEADVQKSLKDDLPGISTQGGQQLTARLRQEFEDDYVKAARREAEKITPDFQARLAAVQAEQENKFLFQYQQAQTNIQPATAWLGDGTAVTPATLFDWPLGDTNGATTPVQSSSSVTVCFTDQGYMGYIDPKDGSCIGYNIVQMVDTPTNWGATTQ